MNLKRQRSLNITVVAASSIAVAAVAVTVGVIHSRADATGRSSTHVAAASNPPVTVDTAVGEMFTPSGSVTALTAQASLSSDEAYAKFGGANSKLPPDAVVQLGYLDLPVGAGSPGEYRADHQLVYAYRWRACAPKVNVPVPNPTAAPQSATPTQVAEAPPACTQWTFLDASTGALVDMTWS